MAKNLGGAPPLPSSAQRPGREIPKRLIPSSKANRMWTPLACHWTPLACHRSTEGRLMAGMDPSWQRRTSHDGDVPLMAGMGD